jgi:protein SCO1/2
MRGVGRAAAGTVTLVTVVAVLAGCAGSSAESPRPHVALRGEKVLSTTASDFSLHDQHGRVVRLSGERGKVVLLTFLYTSCPDVCPTTAAALSVVVRTLGPERRDLRVLAVSVDPTGDTPQAVRRFTRRLRLPPEFHYLTGSRAHLKPIWQAYNLLVEPRNLERVDHSAYVLAIDRNGTPRAYYPHTPNVPAVVHDVRALLAE